MFYKLSCFLPNSQLYQNCALLDPTFWTIFCQDLLLFSLLDDKTKLYKGEAGYI